MTHYRVTFSGTWCHPPKLHRVTLSNFVLLSRKIFFKSELSRFDFSGYKTGNVSTIKILPQNKMAKRFHVPHDTEIEELLEQKDAKNTKKSTASSVRCFRHFFRGQRAVDDCFIFIKFVLVEI